MKTRKLISEEADVCKSEWGAAFTVEPPGGEPAFVPHRTTQVPTAGKTTARGTQSPKDSYGIRTGQLERVDKHTT